MQNEEPVPKLPPAQNEPLFLHVPLDGQGKGDGAADVKVIHGSSLGATAWASTVILVRRMLITCTWWCSGLSLCLSLHDSIAKCES